MASNNYMNFCGNEHGNNILEKLKAQRDQGKFCDVVLYVGGKQFKAHRNVLASSSQFFESILKTHKVIKERLTVTCQSSDIFQSLLDYIYTGCVVIDKNNVGELLRLANHFLVSKLKSYCAEYLDRHLDVTNCLSVREMCEKYNLPSLLKTVTLFVQVNISKIIFEDELLNFTLPKIEEFLSEKAWTVPQDVLLCLISRWVQRDVPARERSIRPLLTFVDWSNLPGSLISEHIDKEQLYATSEISLYFILQALAENSLLFAKYQDIYQTLQQKFSQGCSSLDNDTFLTMAVSTAIEEFHETSENCNASSPSRNMELGMCNGVDKTNKEPVSISGPRKLSKKRGNHWKNKQKLLNLRHPSSRLMAFRNPSATSRKKFTVHRKKLQKAKVKCCHMCTFMTSDTSHLEQHLAAVHGREVGYRCGICGFTCNTNKDYYSHMKSNHFQGPPFKCDSCSFTCELISQLLSHRVEHADGSRFKCQECGFYCSTRTNLSLHMHSHTTAKPIKCDVCGKTFTSKTVLEQHLSLHSLDCPFVCDYCGFSTRFMSHLIAHKRIHTGDIYHCTYPQCQYSAAKKSQLDTHVRVHADRRPYCCPTCGRGFLEKSHLVRHERIHLDEKPFRCNHCDYASSRRDKLKEHFARHHGEQASAKVPYKARPGRVGLKVSCSSGEDYSSTSGTQLQGEANMTNRIDQNPASGHPPQNPAANQPFGFGANVHPPPFDFNHHQMMASRGGGPPPKELPHHQGAAMLDPRLHAAGEPSGPYGQQQCDYPCVPLF